MKITFSLYFFLFISNLCASPIEEILGSLERKNYSKLEQVIKKYQSNKHCAPADEIRKREILKNYNEIVANVIIFSPMTNAKHPGDCNFYKINLLTKSNEIIKYELYSKNISNETSNLINNYFNEEEVRIFQNLYEKNYYRKLNDHELFNGSIIYGVGCGIAGKDPEERERLQELVKANDSKELFQWVTSPCFEIKLYGFEGYRRLVRKGYKLSEKEKVIIDGLQQLYGSVRTCSGCIFMTENFSAIVKDISTQEFPVEIDTLEKVDTILHEIIETDNEKSNETTWVIVSLCLFMLINAGIIYKLKKK